MKKFTFLLFLAIGVIGCSVESLDTNEELLTADANFKVQNTDDPMGFYSGPNLKGNVSIWNDCDNLYIEVIPTGEDPDGVKLGLFQGNDNPKENGTDSDLEDLDMSDGLVWAFPLSEFDELADLRVFAKAWGDYSGTIEWGNTASYFIYEFAELICEEEECESGYMIGDKDFSEIGTSNNWGWAHKFDFEGNDGFEIREIHHKNGSLEGEVTITYENGSISIEEGEGVKITHLYVSDEEPTETNAPGLFDKEQTFEDEDGTFWVIIKAEVCEQ